MRRASAIRRQTTGADTSVPGQGNVIGTRVRQLRQRKSLTLQQLADQIEAQAGFEMHQTTLTRIEQGSRSVYDFEVIALSVALEVDARILLGLIEEDQLL